MKDNFIMAEGNTVQEKSLEELEREITCGICQEHYDEPKILPCLHYYCKKCIIKLAVRTGTDKPFSCPECRNETPLPDGGVDELKTAFFVNRLTTTVSTMERAHGKVEVKCELCKDSSGNAEAFCRQCTRFICGACVDLHKRITVFEFHEIASLTDLKHGRAKPILVKEPPTKKCLVHEKSLKIYCYDCGSLICQHCMLKDHRDHKFEFSKTAAINEKTKLVEEINHLKDLHVKLTNAVEQIQTTKLEVDAQKIPTVNIINSYFKELRDILDKREQELVEETGTIVEEKVDKLSVQEKSLSLASADVQSIADYIEQCVRHCTDNEIISLHAEMRKRIEEKIEEHSMSGSLEPVEEADMGVEVMCTEALQQLCHVQANITKLPIDPTKCTVHVEAAEIDNISKATLLTRVSGCKQTKRKCKVSCQIKSLHNEVITDCNIDDDGSGKYSIQYTPTVRGCHELTVLIDEQHVAGSPFPVFVSIHPTRLGKPVKVWEDVSCPSGITANSKGDILVTEKKGNIIKFDSNGKKERLVAQNELTALRCIQLDDEDNMYCIDQENNKILTCDRNGENLQVHEVEPDEGPGRRSLFIINNELLISEKSSKGTVMVYDRGLKYIIRRIELANVGLVMDISADVRGNLYMTDNHNSCIQVFSANGAFLRSFGHVQKPWRLCVSGQYVYVTDIDHHCVSVFTTDGVYVTSFGQRGSKEGMFNIPYYVYVDKNCFVYVCDYINNRIQCF